MSDLSELGARVIAIGVGATLLFDAWLWLQQRLHWPTMKFELLGRWIGHATRGTWMHSSIAQAPPIRAERAIGWITHYAIGILFACVLVGVAGADWAHQPSVGIALCVGIATAIAPLFIMQPAMGAGIASSKTPTPLRNCARSLMNHAIFGVALYLAAVLVASL